jgi:predicted nucleic acid-binding protein
MYFDSAYIAKYYVNEVDSDPVRKLIRNAPYRCSSSWALIEVHCVLHRHIREQALPVSIGQEVMDAFRSHIKAGFWDLRPVTDALCQTTAMIIRNLPAHVFLRAGDAIHLATALEEGESEVWTSDRHLLAATAHVGLLGKQVNIS